MTTLLVHIGYHKTASSWLQRELFGRTDRGFHPLVPSDDEAGLDPRAFARRLLWAPPFEFDAEAIRGDLERLREEVTAGCPVISHERLSGNPHSGGYDAKELAGRLHAVARDAAILIVIREQTSAILSSYHQYLKVGGVCSLVDYLTRADGIRPSFSRAHFCYHRLIEHYQQLFGQDKILVLPLEMLRQTPELFIARVAQFANTAIPADLPFERAHNVSSEKWLATRTRWLNLFACRNSLNGFSPLAPERKRPVLMDARRRAGRLVPHALERAIERRQFDLIARQTAGYYLHSNRITADLIGIDLAQYGYACGEETAKSCVA